MISTQTLRKYKRTIFFAAVPLSLMFCLAQQSHATAFNSLYLAEMAGEVWALMPLFVFFVFLFAPKGEFRTVSMVVSGFFAILGLAYIVIGPAEGHVGLKNLPSFLQSKGSLLNESLSEYTCYGKILESTAAQKSGQRQLLICTQEKQGADRDYVVRLVVVESIGPYMHRMLGRADLLSSYRATIIVLPGGKQLLRVHDQGENIVLQKSIDQIMAAPFESMQEIGGSIANKNCGHEDDM